MRLTLKSGRYQKLRWESLSTPYSNRQQAPEKPYNILLDALILGCYFCAIEVS